MPNPVAKLEITMMDNGAVSVSGCIDNKLLSYGLLEIARETVQRHCDKADQRIIEPPAGMRIVPPAGL